MQFDATASYTQIGANDWLPSKEYSNVWDFIQSVVHHQRSPLHEVRRGIPAHQIPVLPGSLSSRRNELQRNETAYPSVAGSSNTLTGDAMASFLLGTINNGRISTNNFISSEKVAWAFYAQDDWKVTSKLTVNLGLRYELFSPISEKFARQSNFRLQQPDALHSQGQGPGRSPAAQLRHGVPQREGVAR